MGPNTKLALAIAVRLLLAVIRAVEQGRDVSDYEMRTAQKRVDDTQESLEEKAREEGIDPEEPPPGYGG